MSHRYFPHTKDDVKLMLARCGAANVDEFFSDIPGELRLREPYRLPKAMAEDQVRAYFDELCSENKQLVCFAGAGWYDHYTPSVVIDLARRSEFLTSYTPYQPEISQGTLQYIFEYQSMMASLTGLEVSNASLYDGATAVAETMMMCVAAGRRKNTVLISSTVNPRHLAVARTYARYHGIKLVELPERDGVTDLDSMKAMLGADTAGFIAASPNCHGIVEDFSGVADAVHGVRALFAIDTNASALGVLRTPGEWGADIAVGEAQSLGLPMNYGGPGLGYMCTTRALMRKMPGRIVGATTDADGQRVFVLTLQAREQHIRREKATSNICSNQGLMTLCAAIYLSVMGAEGLREVCTRSHDAATSLLHRLIAEGLAAPVWPDKPFIDEFEVRLHGFSADQAIEEGALRGILPGVKTADDRLLIAVTERRSPAELDKLISLFKHLASHE